MTTKTTATAAQHVTAGALCFRSGIRFRIASVTTSYGVTRIATTDGGTLLLGPDTSVDVVVES